MKTLITLVLFFSVPFAKADPGAFDRGNGGDLVICRKADGSEVRILLDLYEQKYMGFTPWLPKDLHSTHDIVVQVIGRISQRYPTLGENIAHEYLYNFARNLEFAPPEDVPNVKDEGFTFIEPHCELQQLAVQWTEQSSFGKQYRINRNLWITIDPYNQAALVIHELMYRIMLKSSHPQDNSSRLRGFVAFFFSKDFSQFPGLEGPSYFE